MVISDDSSPYICPAQNTLDSLLTVKVTVHLIQITQKKVLKCKKLNNPISVDLVSIYENQYLVGTLSSTPEFTNY